MTQGTWGAHGRLSDHIARSGVPETAWGFAFLQVKCRVPEISQIHCQLADVLIQNLRVGIGPWERRCGAVRQPQVFQGFLKGAPSGWKQPSFFSGSSTSGRVRWPLML